MPDNKTKPIVAKEGERKCSWCNKPITEGQEYREVVDCAHEVHYFHYPCCHGNYRRFMQERV